MALTAYTEKKGERATKMFAKGKAKGEIAEALGITTTTLSRWAKQYKLDTEPKAKAKKAKKD